MIILSKWASVIGLFLTMIGILIGYYKPKTVARWAGPDDEKQEKWIQIKFGFGFLLILIGTTLQIYGSWPP